MTDTEALATHLWVDTAGKPWDLDSFSDACAVCGRTPDAHPRTLTPAAAPSDLRAALEDVMRNVVIGVWYDDPANDPGQAAVNRLHDGEDAMWRLYDLLGIDPGDSFTRRAALSGDRPSPEADPLLEGYWEKAYWNVVPKLQAALASPATAPAELDEERLARAFYTVTQRRFAVSDLMPTLPDWRDPSIAASVWDRAVADGAEIAAEYLAPDSAQVAKLSSSTQPPDSAQEAE